MPVDIQDRVENHEQRITKIEIDGARLDARLEALVSSTNNLKWGLFCFSFLMLLALIYQAIGPNGYKEVTNTMKPVVQEVQK